MGSNTFTVSSSPATAFINIATGLIEASTVGGLDAKAGELNPIIINKTVPNNLIIIKPIYMKYYNILIKKI
ncbi:MAG: hypothetical protein JKY85_04625 [Porticoccus sp.]|nr:hypothetical protein [Porticoccus sp.]